MAWKISCDCNQIVYTNNGGSAERNVFLVVQNNSYAKLLKEVFSVQSTTRLHHSPSMVSSQL
jgi:hypothetical protein